MNDLAPADRAGATLDVIQCNLTTKFPERRVVGSYQKQF